MLSSFQTSMLDSPYLPQFSVNTTPQVALLRLSTGTSSGTYTIAYTSSVIEMIQIRFLRLLALKLSISQYQHEYSPVKNLLQLLSLADHRHVYNLSFLSNIFVCKIDSLSLRSQICLKVPHPSTLVYLIHP